jgi:carboxyl-terminal processing protease
MKKSYRIIINVLAIIILAILVSFVRERLFFSYDDKQKSKNLTKFNQILKYVDNFYVEPVNWEESLEGAISGFLSKLDPHSVYIPSSDAAINEENFQGKYQGIGIYFEIIDGYITVIAPISNSPSDKIGLISGDKIIKINGEAVYNISNEEVQKRLKGPKNSKVNITVSREGFTSPLEFTVIRDEIPIYSINTFFITKEKTGYISLNRFAKTTEDEIEEVLLEFEHKGLERLLIDLRGNAGGFLDQAVKLAGKFIPGHKLIVSTKGRLDYFDENYYSDTYQVDKIQNIPLIVLIDRSSASASEIFAGAIQDYDRGLIVGTPSFGKGLVQKEFNLDDSSKLRLTVSKYYTPSGRLIQRPYKGKSIDDYYLIKSDSFSRNENTDSLLTQQMYHTFGGRPVYGGGGISPDITIESNEQLDLSSMTVQLLEKRIFFEFAAQYAQKNRYLKKSFERYLANFKVDSFVMKEFKNYIKKKKIEIKEMEFKKDIKFIASRLKSEIARSLWNNEKYYQVRIHEDKQYLEAVQLFPQAEELLKKYSTVVKN